MKLIQKKKINLTVPLLILLAFGACKKSNSGGGDDQQGTTRVIVKMLGVDENSQPLATNSTDTGKLAVNSVNSPKIQTQVIPFNKDYSITATLVPQGMTVDNATKGSLSTNAISSKLQTSAITPAELGKDVKYKVVVYDINGLFVTSKDYAYGNEGMVGDFKLNADQTYNFVAYSYNSKTELLPAISPSASSALAVARLLVKAGDLMVFTTQLRLVAGNNNLNIVLKHMNSQITTNINLLAASGKNIEGIGNLGTLVGGTPITISPSAVSSGINLANSTLFYANTGTPSYGSVNVSFPTISAPGVTAISSAPTMLYNPGTTSTTTATWSGMIAVAGIAKPVSISGLSINPGVKYNLNLTINALTGTGASDGCAIGVPFSIPGLGYGDDLILAAPTTMISRRKEDGLYNPQYYGFAPNGNSLDENGNDIGKYKKTVLNFTSLNYGFELQWWPGQSGIPKETIVPNGYTPPIIVDDRVGYQMLLDLDAGSPLVRNIKFEDGSQYGMNGVPKLSTLTNTFGSTKGPVIRVEIDAAGKLTMYGIKRSGTTATGLAPLYKLVPVNGWQFNTFNPAWDYGQDASMNSYSVVLNSSSKDIYYALPGSPGYPANSYAIVNGVVVTNKTCP